MKSNLKSKPPFTLLAAIGFGIASMYFGHEMLLSWAVVLLGIAVFLRT